MTLTSIVMLFVGIFIGYFIGRFSEELKVFINGIKKRGIN